MGMQTGSAVPGSQRLAGDREWVRWGVGAAVTAMLAWVAGVALIPLDAKLDKGGHHLAQVLAAHTGQLYAAALLAVLGAVLLAGFFAVLTRLVPEGYPGWGLLRVSLAGCVITQTMVAVGASFAPDGIIAALVLLTTVVWILALAATLPRSWHKSRHGRAFRRVETPLTKARDESGAEKGRARRDSGECLAVPEH